jgi:multidrug efflux system membrane fusion protein
MSVPSPPFNSTETPPELPRRTWRHRIWWIVGFIAAVVVVVLVIRNREAAQATNGRFRQGPLTVGIGRVTTGDMPITLIALGTVTPLATVTVHPQVTGPLVKIDFTEGQLVKAGQLLAEIDPRPFQDALDQATGALKRDQAALANARIDLDRYKTLVAEDSVAEQTYATQQATVGQDVAIVATDQAAVESAQLNLSYCRITSPVAGLVGLRQVDLGNLLQANSSTIVVVTQMQPMSVLFTVPEDSLTAILERLRRGEKLAVTAFDRSLTSKIATGTLFTADNEIDPTTGTLKLRAMFDNAKLELFPSQFVNVQLLLDTLRNQVIVPGAGLQNGAAGAYVYVVNANSTVNVRAVKTGPSSGDKVAIMDGLTAGETVVTDGADQLRDGAQVILPTGGSVTGGGAGARRNGNGPGGGTRRRNGQGQGQGNPGGGTAP